MTAVSNIIPNYGPVFIPPQQSEATAACATAKSYAPGDIASLENYVDILQTLYIYLKLQESGGDQTTNFEKLFYNVFAGINEDEITQDVFQTALDDFRDKITNSSLKSAIPEFDDTTLYTLAGAKTLLSRLMSIDERSISSTDQNTFYSYLYVLQTLYIFLKIQSKGADQTTPKEALFYNVFIGSNSADTNQDVFQEALNTFRNDIIDRELINQVPVFEISFYELSNVKPILQSLVNILAAAEDAKLAVANQIICAPPTVTAVAGPTITSTTADPDSAYPGGRIWIKIAGTNLNDTDAIKVKNSSDSPAGTIVLPNAPDPTLIYYRIDIPKDAKPGTHHYNILNPADDAQIGTFKITVLKPTSVSISVEPAVGGGWEQTNINPSNNEEYIGSVYQGGYGHFALGFPIERELSGQSITPWITYDNNGIFNGNNSQRVTATLQVSPWKRVGFSFGLGEAFGWEQKVYAGDPSVTDDSQDNSTTINPGIQIIPGDHEVAGGSLSSATPGRNGSGTTTTTTTITTYTETNGYHATIIPLEINLRAIQRGNFTLDLLPRYLPAIGGDQATRQFLTAAQLPVRAGYTINDAWKIFLEPIATWAPFNGSLSFGGTVGFRVTDILTRQSDDSFRPTTASAALAFAQPDYTQGKCQERIIDLAQRRICVEACKTKPDQVTADACIANYADF